MSQEDETPSAIPGGVHTSFHPRQGTALGETIDAKGIGAGAQFMHRQVTRLVVLTLSNLVYRIKATAAEENNLSTFFFFNHL